MMRFPALSLRAHLLVLVCLAVLPVAGILSFSSLDRQREALQLSRQLVQTQSASIAKQQQLLVDSLHQLLVALSALPEVRNQDRKACDTIFARWAAQNPRIATLFAADPDGAILSATAPLGVASVADRAYFRDAMRERRFSGGDYTPGRLAQTGVIHFALPVLDESDRPRSVLVVGVDLAGLRAAFDKSNQPLGSTLTLLDRQGTILQTNQGIEPLGQTIPPAALHRLLDRLDRGGFEESGPRGIHLVSAHGLFLSGAQHPYMLVKASIPERAILQEPRRDFLRNLGLLFLVAAGAGLAAWMVGTRLIVDPVRRLAAYLDRLGRGEKAPGSGLSESGTEIGELAASVDAMAEALHTRDGEQEQAKATLRLSQQLLDLFFSQSLDGFYIATLATPLRWDDTVDRAAAVETLLENMRVEMVNEAMLAQYGMTSEEFLGKSIGDFYAHDMVFARQLVRDFLDHGRVHQETPERKADGSPLWIEGDYLCVYNEEGLVIGNFGIQRDITQRKLAEQELRASEQKFRAIFDNAFQMIGLLETDGTVLAVNRTSVEFAGADEKEILGRPFWETPWWQESPEDQRRLREAIGEAAQGRLVRFETSHRDKESVLHFVDFSLKPYVDAEGTVRLLIPEGRDITERKQAEEILTEREQLFRLLFECSGDANLLFDGNVFVDCNEATVKLLGARTKQELLHLHPSELSPLTQPDGSSSLEKANALIVTAFQRGSHRFEWVHRKLDGTEFPVDVMLTAIPWQGKWILHTAWRDLSDQKRAEEDRRTLEGQMQQAQRLESLGVLAGGIAHDFNNLLTALLGNLNLVHLNTPEESPAVPFLDSAETTVLRASDLVKQMLAYSGKGRFVVKLHDLNLVVREMAHLLQVSIPKKIALRFDMATELPPLEADSAQIQQVILNLVTNAADAIGAQEGAITLRTTSLDLDAKSIAVDYPAQGLTPGPHVVLEVSDTGCGIPSDLRERIFEPFFTTKLTGRGLGLAAMLGILRGHHAGIQIQSEVGRGSTFRLAFPAGKGLIQATQTEKSPIGPLSQATILVVDDEPMVLEMAESSLMQMGCQVLTARDGLEALEIYRTHHERIDLVVMDLTMPRMDGREAFEEMEKVHPGVRVILSSGFSEQETVPQLLGKGLAGFLQKPYTLAVLRRMVQEALSP